MKASRRAGGALGVALLLALPACGGGVATAPTAADSPVAVSSKPAPTAPTAPAGRPATDALPAFADCAELTAHLRKVGPAHVTTNAPYAEDNAYSGYDTSDLGGRLLGSAPSAPVPDPAAADVAATDGRLLATVREGRLHLVDVTDAKPRLLASLDVPGHGNEWDSLVLAGDRLLVLSPADSGRPDMSLGGPAGAQQPPRDHTTDLTIVDVGDPAHPKVLSTEAITGRLIATQRTGDVVRVVLVTDPENRLAPTGDIGVVRNQVFVRNTVAVDWLPDRQIRDGGGQVLTEGPLLECSAVRRPLQESGLDVLSILALDLTRDDALAAAPAVGVLASGDLVVSSASRLFVATTPGWTSYNAKGAAAPAPTHPRTQVHAFDLSAATGTPYAGSGELDGYVPGAAALSARGDVLRAVTSVRPPWPGADHARKDTLGVEVLTLRQGRIEPAGSVHGLGAGRRWKAIRWLDDAVAVAPLPKAVSMSFPNEDADPYVLVSLTGPGAPRIVQSLDLDQRVAHLVPVGGGRAIGVGQRSTRGMGELSLEIVALGRDGSGGLKQTRLVSYGQGETWGAAPGFTWLPGPRLLVLQGWTDPSMGCHAPVPCLKNPAGTGASAVSLHVGENGDLRASGWYSGGLGGIRMLPLGDRLAAVGDGVVLLDPATMEETGSVTFPRPAGAG